MLERTPWMTLGSRLLFALGAELVACGDAAPTSTLVLIDDMEGRENQIQWTPVGGERQRGNWFSWTDTQCEDVQPPPHSWTW